MIVMVQMVVMANQTPGGVVRCPSPIFRHLDGLIVRDVPIVRMSGKRDVDKWTLHFRANTGDGIQFRSQAFHILTEQGPTKDGGPPGHP